MNVRLPVAAASQAISKLADDPADRSKGKVDRREVEAARREEPVVPARANVIECKGEFNARPYL
jgi:hypothetical protein